VGTAARVPGRLCRRVGVSSPPLPCAAPRQSGDPEPLPGTLALAAMEDAWAELVMLSVHFSKK